MKNESEIAYLKNLASWSHQHAIGFIINRMHLSWLKKPDESLRIALADCKQSVRAKLRRSYEISGHRAQILQLLFAYL